jgi:hypothetical protein
VDRRDDARIEELNNLKLALVTFALQLDAFEMKMTEATFGLTSASSTRPRDMASRLQENWIGGR